MRQPGIPLGSRDWHCTQCNASECEGRSFLWQNRKISENVAPSWSSGTNTKPKIEKLYGHRDMKIIYN